jgi:hypothetical protein
MPKPAAASWAPDRLDVFVRTKTGSLLHSWLDHSFGGIADHRGSLVSNRWPWRTAQDARPCSCEASATSSALADLTADP